MKIEISLDWLTLYACILVSALAGYLGYSIFWITLAAFILLAVQIVAMPTCAYNKGKGFMQRARIRTYSYSDMLSQYALDLAVCVLFFFMAKGITYLLA